MSDLIEGTNPLTISKITLRRGHRYGIHPYLKLLRSRKYPLLNKIGYFSDISYDFWEKATVNIHGSDGSVIRTLHFKNNEKAEETKKLYYQNLSSYLESIKIRKGNDQ